MKIRISAIVCTLNRTYYLRQAIQSLVNQTLPSEQYEIIVVDNGSNSSTAEMVSKHFGHVENLRYVRQPSLGLSRARNAGWQSAKGHYIAFLDDDAVASASWLQTIVNVFEQTSPKPGCVGGKIEPIWESPRPVWLSDEMLPFLTVLDWSDVPIELIEDQWIAGANMAFPRETLNHCGGFRLNFGRKGQKLLSNEELVLQRQIIRDGYTCLYHPEVYVQHHILASRLNKRWFIRRVYWQSVSDAIVHINRDSLSAMERLKIGFSTARRVTISKTQLFNLLRPANDPKAFTLKCSAVSHLGYAMGLWGFAR